MLSFYAFDTSPVRTPLRHAYMLGPEDLQVSGTITHDAEASLIRCEKPEGETAALALQIDLGPETFATITAPVTTGAGLGDGASDLEGIGPPGVVTLQTCLLPDRDTPYLLTLELARHRIMLFLNKLEDWQLFDLRPNDPVMLLFERARSLFTKALCAPRDTPDHLRTADVLATRALCLAIHAGERLVLRDTAKSFVPRITGQAYIRARHEAGAGPIAKGKPVLPISSPERVGLSLPGRPALGCAVSPGSFNERFQETAERTCDFVTMPMRWVELEPSEGVYHYGPTDRWIEWAVRKAKLPVVAGPLIDFRPSSVPEWIYIWENDYETLRDLVHDHLRNVVTRYRRTITRWTVASGLHANTNFRLSFDQIMDLTKLCVSVVRKLHPTGRIQLELTQPWGEYYSANRRALPPLLYAEMVTQAGVMVDSYAIRLQMGQPQPGQSVRDLMAVSSLMDRYAALDKPLAVTIGVPSGMPEAASDPKQQDRYPGYWHKAWSEDAQADWAMRVASMLLAKPFIQSVCWHELYDLPQPAEMPRGGLVAVNGHPKPAADRLGELRDAVREGRMAPGLAEAAGVLVSQDG